MRLRYIELFHAILTTGSLTGAAQMLHVSQPAASKALQHAEDQLGFALFNRVRGRLLPTEQAQLLRPGMERIIHELHDLQRLAVSMDEPQSVPLRVTCTPALALTLVPDAIVLLRKVFPGTVAELYTQHSTVMCEALALHEVDIGLTLQATGAQTLRCEPLCRGHVMVIAPPGWWPESELSRPLPVSALADQPLVGITVSDALGNMLQSHLAQLDPAPRVTTSVQTYQLAYALVAQGEGLALVDPFTARTLTGKGVQKRPLKLHLDVVLYAMHRLDCSLNGVQKRFIELVRQLARRTLAQP